MTCILEGEFDGFYNKDNKKINDTGIDAERYKISEEVDEDGKTLKKLDIIKVTEEDYGDYECKDDVSTAVATLEISGVYLN